MTHTEEQMSKWIFIGAIVVLAPTFVINTFSSFVKFTSNQGKALVSEMAKEATKTVQEVSE
jgi:hypothetical protein